MGSETIFTVQVDGETRRHFTIAASAFRHARHRRYQAEVAKASIVIRIGKVVIPTNPIPNEWARSIREMDEDQPEADVRPVQVIRIENGEAIPPASPKPGEPLDVEYTVAPTPPKPAKATLPEWVDVLAESLFVKETQALRRVGVTVIGTIPVRAITAVYADAREDLGPVVAMTKDGGRFYIFWGTLESRLQFVLEWREAVGSLTLGRNLYDVPPIQSPADLRSRIEPLN